MKLLDNSCISLFILEIPKYDFLNELYDMGESLNITNHVLEEFQNNDDLDKLEDYISNNKIHLEEIDYAPQLKMRYPNLGDGELSIIQWGLNLSNQRSYYCVLDDLLARKVAKRLNLSIFGSIGLIILVKNKNNYSDDKIKEIIESIDASNFRIGKNILNRLWG